MSEDNKTVALYGKGWVVIACVEVPGSASEGTIVLANNRAFEIVGSRGTSRHLVAIEKQCVKATPFPEVSSSEIRGMKADWLIGD